MAVENWGLNEKGYYRPSYNEILEYQIKRAESAFGENIDTDTNSVLGKILRIHCYDIAKLYEAQEAIYYSRFPHTATQQSLDRLMPFASIKRNTETSAVHYITVYGKENSVISAMSLKVATIEGLQFMTMKNYTIGDTGFVENVEVYCTTKGTQGNVTVGDIKLISSQNNTNINSIEHTGIKQLGENMESDVELRKRFDTAIAGNGKNTYQSIKGAIMRVSGVENVTILANETDKTDENNIPPNQFMCLVSLGNANKSEVATAIFKNKPFGYRSYGDQSYNVVDDDGKSHTISYSICEELKIKASINVEVDTNFESNGVEKIKTALCSYVSTFEAGKDLMKSSLYSFIFAVAGVRNVSAIKLSTAFTQEDTDYADNDENNVIVDMKHIARLPFENISIEVNNYADQ